MPSYVSFLIYPSFTLRGEILANGRNCSQPHDSSACTLSLYIRSHLQDKKWRPLTGSPILSTKGLTLYRVSQLLPRFRSLLVLFHTPTPLLRPCPEGLIPSIHQLLALSQISNYQLCDWMAIFGFRLDDIPRLQLGIPWRRQSSWIRLFMMRISGLPGFRNVCPIPHPCYRTIGATLKLGTPRRARDCSPLTETISLCQDRSGDVYAFPTLTPEASLESMSGAYQTCCRARTGSNKNIFLVENGPILNCGHLRIIDKNRIVLCSIAFPFTQVEFTLGRGARILDY